ncbi:peptidase S41 (plasmid) [Brevundimonas staleyi]|uniref:Peptidase S41 n=1 Tax=Brevundimonas staleyi TaxID=74326 RepID=A0ABW0FT43_9CAUL
MLSVLMAALAGAFMPVEPDWPSILRNDATAFHDLIAANHPGPADPLNPGFSELNDAALRQALERSEKVKDYAGYVGAMRGYVARFDDSHLAYSVTDGPSVVLAWPGFLTTYTASGRYVVTTRLPDSPLETGDMLAECDGRSADALAASALGAFTGRWMLEATRSRTAWQLFTDDGNPFVQRPETCVFERNGSDVTVSLTWRAFTDEAYELYAAPLADPPTPALGSRVLADGTRWFSFSSFDGAPDGYVARRIEPMVAELERDHAELAKAPRIVLDLRGNGGGSSLWSRRIAGAIWGDKATAEAAPTSDGVDWRVSPANVEMFLGFRTKFAAAPAHIREYVEKMIAGLSEAHELGRPLWREPKGLLAEDAETHIDSGDLAPLDTPVYVVTDTSCASACLDAVDLWRALGAVQVGRETDADTFYMDARRDALPSGLGQAVVPMKVYRGRPRGSNAPWSPVRRFSGDIDDTSALEDWIIGLAPPAASSGSR